MTENTEINSDEEMLVVICYLLSDVFEKWKDLSRKGRSTSSNLGELVTNAYSLAALMLEEVSESRLEGPSKKKAQRAELIQSLQGTERLI